MLASIGEMTLDLEQLLRVRFAYAGRFDASRYFRGNHRLRFYNVGTNPMRALARSIHAEHRAVWSIGDAMRFADAIIADPYLETKSVGIEVVARYRKDFTPSLMSRWKRWLAVRRWLHSR